MQSPQVIVSQAESHHYAHEFLHRRRKNLFTFLLTAGIKRSGHQLHNAHVVHFANLTIFSPWRATDNFHQHAFPPQRLKHPVVHEIRGSVTKYVLSLFMLFNLKNGGRIVLEAHYKHKQFFLLLLHIQCLHLIVCGVKKQLSCSHCCLYAYLCAVYATLDVVRWRAVGGIIMIYLLR